MDFVTQKEKALEFLTRLKVHKSYIDNFRMDGTVYIFENFCGQNLDDKPELQAKIKELEDKHGIMIYAVTHEYSSDFDFFNFLIVTNEEEEWDILMSDYGQQHRVLAYVWNKKEPYYSEFGSVIILSCIGGINRIY